MSQNILIYPVLGLLLALAGFGYYAMAVFRAYNEEKRRIEEDFELSKNYNPKLGFLKILILIEMGSMCVAYVVLGALLISLFGSDSYPNSSLLVSRYVFLMGVIAFIVSFSRTPAGKYAARDMAYIPSVEVPDEIKNIDDVNERWKKKMEFFDQLGLRNGNKYFGRHVVLLTLPETQSIFLLLTFTLLIVGTEFLNQNADPSLANKIFLAGVAYVIISIAIIPSMKKAAEISMDEFGKKLMKVAIGSVPSIIGLVIMICAMLPLIS